MENYEVLNLIGRGNFGSISKVIRRTDNKLFVWKELDYGRMSEKEKQNIVSEVNILRELRHPNIVRYEDRIIDKKNTKIYIIMEFCEGGDIGQLIKRLKAKREHIPEEVVWKILTQLILALHECHNHKEGKILHRDIKPSNVFLDLENNVKLGDFGLSRILSNESVFAYSHVGTPYYMSPEQIEDVRYNDKSDIWSLGCFLYELTTFSPPFEATNQLSLALKIKAGKVEPVSNKYSIELNNIIMWLLNVDQNKRPSIDELLNIPQILLRIRERKLKENYMKMKKMEESIKERDAQLKDKESEYSIRENSIVSREKDIGELEATLKMKEQELIEREIEIKAMTEKINNQLVIRQQTNVIAISQEHSFQIINQLINIKPHQAEECLKLGNSDMNEYENIYSFYQVNNLMNKSDIYPFNTQKQLLTTMDPFLNKYDHYNHSNNRNGLQTDQINSYLTDDNISYPQNPSKPLSSTTNPQSHSNISTRTGRYAGVNLSAVNSYINPTSSSIPATSSSQRKLQPKNSFANPSSTNSVKNSIQKSVTIKKTMSLKLPMK